MVVINNFSESDRLCSRAQEIIPGGSHTYSKGPDQSPKLGPKFIEKGKGSHIWDIDGNEYIDWAMGLTSVSIGHAYEPIIEEVKKELVKGTNFQCPAPIEVELAERFLEEVPSAEMVKFAKNGSSVTTAAVKLARAYTGKKYVAFCLDHGFFSYDDWYIGHKPNNAGVLEESAKYSIGFQYNNIESLKKLFAKHKDQIACVILEPMEFDYPQDKFLHKVKQLCAENGAVFILDEMITGFRLGHPGAHSMLDIEPDLSTWGKGVANGFSVCMLAGKKEIMELGGLQHKKEKVFLISTTHGAETHALRAALATLQVAKKENSQKRMEEVGTQVKNRFEKLIKDKNLENYVSIKGHPSWLLVIFKDENGKPCNGFRTLIFQELIKLGIFFRGTFVPTLSHSLEDIEKTFQAFDKVFDLYKTALSEGGYKKYLVGEPIKPVFRKYN
jgi:glutamate-1-semialdehyde 2,1-aminomutase